ncbi:MAG: S-layer homology domain-containing protein [Ruminiclostridium sp.]|nr:S-layer homology domain-containing protein [Ruminiclostridium sp.]
MSGSSNTAAFKITSTAGAVNITLADGSVNTLKSGNNCAGLQKDTTTAGTMLTISGTGTLNATGGYGNSTAATGDVGAAGIGGGMGGNGSNITISGGTVTATGCGGAAGIGGGYKGLVDPNPGNGSDITISGGTVTAKGGYDGAGIGGGLEGNGSNIIISGGTVKATRGSSNAANIGGGFGGSGSYASPYIITLSGSNSTAVTTFNFTPARSYGTNDMKTDAFSNLYLYLSGSSRVHAVTTAGTYEGYVSGNTTLDLIYTVSGTVYKGTTDAIVSGLTVNLYASTDTTFGTSLSSAVTDESGAYSICVPNGSYVARVAGVSGSHADSVSDTIAVSSSAVNDANITLSPMAYTGPSAETPSLISKTDTQVVLNTVTVAGQTVEYGKNTSDVIPSEWQNNTTFTGLEASTTYYFFARVKQAGAVDAGGVSSVLTVTTKTAPAAAPAEPTIGIAEDKPISTSITVSTVAGNEYYISTSATADWNGTPNGYFKADDNGTHKFDSLSPATKYYIHFRTAETENAMPSASGRMAQYTLPVTPAANDATIDYEAETISFDNTHEVSTTADFTTASIANGSIITPGTTYYVRVKAIIGGAPASESVSITITVRPATPSAITAANITRTDTGITVTNTVDGQEYYVNGTWYTPTAGQVEVTGLTAGTDYSIMARVKANANTFASANSEALTVRTKTSSAALHDSGVTYSVKNGTITGLWNTYEYSLDNGATWQTAPVTGVTFATGNVIQVRTTETYDAMPSLSQTLGTIGALAAAPAYVIDYINEKTTVSVPATVEYNTTSSDAAVWMAGSGAPLMMSPGTTCYFRTAATDAALPGNVQTLEIHARPDAPDVSVVNIGIGNSASHTVITLANTYEYSLADALPDISASGVAGTGSASEITAAGGQHVYIRVKAVANASFASAWTDCGEVRLGVDDINLTGVGYDVAAGTLTGTTTNMQYSLDGGSIWQDCSVGNTSGLTFIADTVKVRQKDKVTNEAIVCILASPAESSAPTLETKSYNSVTLTAMTGYEYSGDGGATWQDSNVFTGLGSSSPYSFLARIKATATTLPGKVSTALTVTTSSEPSGGSISPGKRPAPTPTPVPTGAPVIVDGKTVNIGTENKTGDATTVTVDQSKLGENINGAAAGSSVEVPVSENGAVTASLVVKNIEDMAQKGMTLTVKTGSVAYNLNTSAIDTAALAAAFPGADMSKVPFDVTIENSSVSVEGETLVLSPVTFTVTAAFNGKTVNVDTFSAYINRVIEVTAEQATKISTAVVVNADGSTRHVPTNVIEKDGRYYAVINSLTNSTYALIQNEVTFNDASGKWYEAAANEMGSRKIIQGRSAFIFDGGASITRAEFAAILIRALGLPADGTSSFSDVPATAWYTGTVATAVQYGLVAGKGENRFDPNANITRQEAMLMLQRAASLTEFSGTSSALDGFADADSISSWAEDAAKWSVGSGLIQGVNGKLNPTANITRAESAVIILRLLQKAGLVDVRS